jgi:hypothetical protein
MTDDHWQVSCSVEINIVRKKWFWFHKLN